MSMFLLLFAVTLAVTTAFLFLYRKGFFVKKFAGTGISFPFFIQSNQAGETPAPVRKYVPEETPATDALEAVSLELEELQFVLEQKKAERHILAGHDDAKHMLAVELDMLDTTIQALERKADLIATEMEKLRPAAARLDELEDAHRVMADDLSKITERLEWAKLEVETLEEALQIKERNNARLAHENNQLKQKIELLQSLNCELDAIAEARKR